MSDRAIAPAVGVVLLLGLCSVLAAVTLFIVWPVAITGSSPSAAISGSVDASANVVTLEHAGGDTLQLETITFELYIDQVPLAEQPPIPFFSATGFHSGPTGPFNSATANTWCVGERGSFTLAHTNEPLPDANTSVRVVVRHAGSPVTTAMLEHE